jgi:hypothetical protein
VRGIGNHCVTTDARPSKSGHDPFIRQSMLPQRDNFFNA